MKIEAAGLNAGGDGKQRIYFAWPKFGTKNTEAQGSIKSNHCASQKSYYMRTAAGPPLVELSSCGRYQSTSVYPLVPNW